MACEREVNCESSPILSPMQIFTILENKCTNALCPLSESSTYNIAPLLQSLDIFCLLWVIFLSYHI